MKTVFSNSELAHVWARESQDYGKSSSMHFSTYIDFGFNVSNIYSYSTLMGSIVTNSNGEKLVVLNTARYSNTTSKHQSHIRYAINHYERVVYPIYLYNNFDIYSQLSFNQTVKKAHNQVANLMLSAQKRRVESTRNQDLVSANTILNDIGTIAKFFNYEYVKPLTFDDIIEDIKKAEAKAKAEQAEELEAWKQGANFYRSFSEVALRIKDDVIQTTKGAQIPVADAIKVWPIFERALKSDKSITSNNERLTLGNYSFTSFNRNNDGLLIVACHQIPVSEVVRIANVLGLAK